MQKLGKWFKVKNVTSLQKDGQCIQNKIEKATMNIFFRWAETGFFCRTFSCIVISVCLQNPDLFTFVLKIVLQKKDRYIYIILLGGTVT